MTEAELFKQMEQGKLISAEVLPKVAQAYKEAAKQGGAYDEALKGLRVTEGQLITQSQRAGNTIFKGGFEAGLSDLFKTLSESLSGMEPQLRKLGKLFGVFFKGLARAIEVLTPLLKLLVDNFELIFGTLAIKKMLSFALASKAVTGAVVALSGGFRALAASIVTSMSAALLPVTALAIGIAGLMEMIGAMDDSTINIQEAMRGYQTIGGKKMEIKKVDGQWYRTGRSLGKTDSSLGQDYMRVAAKAASPLFNGLSNAYESGVNVVNNITVDGSRDPKLVADAIADINQQTYNRAMKGGNR